MNTVPTLYERLIEAGLQPVTDKSLTEKTQQVRMSVDTIRQLDNKCKGETNGN